MPAVNQVLLIEDSRVQAKIIQSQILAIGDFKSVAAHSMREAETILNEYKGDLPFFVAVVDLNLPDAYDGEAVDMTLAHGLPTVVLTATFSEELRQRFIDKEVADYFLKGSIKDMDPMLHILERLYRNRSVKAMVVDDSRTARNLVKRLLQIQQLQVFEASDGAEALRVLEDHPDIRLIVTDYNMPNLDGFELTVAIREQYKMDQLSIVGFSGQGDPTLTARFLKNGANDFLKKPFEVEEFYWRINQSLAMLDVVCELRECHSVQAEEA